MRVLAALDGRALPRRRARGRQGRVAGAHAGARPARAAGIRRPRRRAAARARRGRQRATRCARRAADAGARPGDRARALRRPTGRGGVRRARRRHRRWRCARAPAPRTRRGASFAGQQETYLHVRGADAVRERVRDCWASFFCERALFYREQKGSLDDLEMAVVVQRMVEPDVAGMLFTGDPVQRPPRPDGRRGGVRAGRGRGLGQRHARQLRDRARRHGPQGADRRAAVRARRRPGRRDGGARARASEGAAQTLGEDDLRRLAELGDDLEQRLGAPQDIEWAIAGGVLYVLQSRPVTTLEDALIERAALGDASSIRTPSTSCARWTGSTRSSPAPGRRCASPPSCTTSSARTPIRARPTSPDGTGRIRSTSTITRGAARGCSRAGSPSTARTRR